MSTKRWDDSVEGKSNNDSEPKDGLLVAKGDCADISTAVIKSFAIMFDRVDSQKEHSKLVDASILLVFNVSLLIITNSRMANAKTKIDMVKKYIADLEASLVEELKSAK